MPELPEVETVVRSLQRSVLDREIAAVVHVRPDIVTPAGFDLAGNIAGRVVRAVERRGKRIVFRLDDGNQFYIHLGMSGRIGIESTSDPIRKHTHLILELMKPRDRSRAFLQFSDPRRFGGIWWLGKESPAGTMGPEPLTIRPEQLLKRLMRTRRPIKNALLDQTIIAGIGNIYADESLFRAGIHPLTPSHLLSLVEVRRLNRAIKTTLRAALRHRGSTLRDYVDADGNKGSYQKKHKVYDRKDQPCRRCRTPIERIVLTARSAHFCPNCQPSQQVSVNR